jgi:26S proteasome regulatory subunit, ATPase 3, interacting protein
MFVSVSCRISVVFSFLSWRNTQQNRPFSVQNIVDALQKFGVKKTGVERALAALVAKGVVSKKEYGKMSIFILAQDKLELPDQGETEVTDIEIKDLSGKIQVLGEDISNLREQIARLQSIRTLEEAREELQRLESEISTKEAKLEKVGDGSELIDEEEKLQLETAYFKVFSAWKKRKSMVRNVADLIGESSGMKAKDFYSEVGVETDEDVNIDIAQFPEIKNPCKPIRNPTKKQRTM